MRENIDNSNKKHKVNKTCIFHSNKKSIVNDLIIPKNIKCIEEHPIFSLKNNNLLLKEPSKINPIYQKLLKNTKKINNLKKKIDTSVSVEKKKIKKNKKIKIKSNTPLKYIRCGVNPFTYRQDNLKYDNNTLDRKKILYYPKYLITKKIDLSADKVKQKKHKDIIYPSKIQYFGALKKWNIKIEKIRKGYVLTPLKIQYITKYGASADKVSKNEKLLKNNLIKNNNKKPINIKNIKELNKNVHKQIVSDIGINSNITPVNIPKKIIYKKVDVKNVDNIRKNNIIKYKTIETARTPINGRIINKEEGYKKLSYYNIINNNFNTIQTNRIKNYLIKDNNNQTNNTLNTNTTIRYNNFIYHENNNINNNPIKKEKKIINNKIKLRKKINIENGKYIPLSLRVKKPLNNENISNIHGIINLTNESHINKNNIYINNFLISNIINLNSEQIKKNVEGFCKKYHYKYKYLINNNKFKIDINDINSFILEINSDTKNKIIKLYHYSGSEEITKKIMNEFWLEMSKNFYS